MRWGNLPAEGWGTSATDDNAARRVLRRRVPGVTRKRGPEVRPLHYTVSPALHQRLPVAERRRVVPVLDHDRSPVIVEVDLRSDPETEDTRTRFREVFARAFRRSVHPPDPPGLLAAAYLTCRLSPDEIHRLLTEDRGRDGTGPRTVFRVWPDYTMRAHIDRSVSTIKSDAVLRAYAATGEGVVWAVLDSGIDAHHPHFSCGTLDGPVAALHRDFTGMVAPVPDPAPPEDPLSDPDGHGTHVAGIIAGRLPDGTTPVIGALDTEAGGFPEWSARTLAPGRTLAGMAPQAKLVSLKVLAPRGADGELVTSSSAVIGALYYVRETVNTGGRMPVIHGVNLSLGCPWDPRDYACGRSPVCQEVNLLAASGVVVVVSAGNGGFGGDLPFGADSDDVRGVLATITDPGNADGAITVGSTHRDRPHEFGVTYSSSKGPTLDGRLKPDLLAPGERITSCATGRTRAELGRLLPAGVDPDGLPAYAEDSGTSMAAPHVSGAIASFLSARAEYVGRAAEVKQLFCANATSLGRDRYLEGNGLVDLMRVMSSV